MQAGPRSLGAPNPSGRALPTRSISKSMVMEVVGVAEVVQTVVVSRNVVVAASIRQLQTPDSESVPSMVRLGLSREILQVSLPI